MDKVSYANVIGDLSDVMVIIQPIGNLYKVSAYVIDLGAKETTKFDFEPTDFDIAMETCAHFIGDNPEGKFIS